MKGKFEHKESRGLPGGPNEQFTYITGVFSVDGYKADSPDVNNPFNVIPSGNITMKGVDFPVIGTDNLGNTKLMKPGKDYKFPGDMVFEVPMAQFGGMTRKKVDKILDQNKNLNFVQRMYQENTPSMIIPGQKGPSTHFMESSDNIVYPTVVQMPDGTLQYLGDGAYNYAIQTGEYIKLPNEKQAKIFGESYKKGTGVLKDFQKSEMQRGGQMNVEGQKQRNWFDSYIRSDKYLERLGKEMTGFMPGAYDADKVANERRARLMNLRNTPVRFLPESSEISPTPGDVQGVYDADEYPGMIMLRPEYSKGRQGPWSYNTIPLHEMGHAADEGGKRIPQSTKDLLMSTLKDNDLGIPKEEYYYTQPTEYINRLQPLRYLLQEEGIYDARKEDFTEKHLQKAKENTRIELNRHFQDLLRNTKSEKDLINLMNIIAMDERGQGLPTAQFGGATTQDSLDLYNKNLAAMKILESQGWKRQVIDSDLSQALSPSKVSNTLNIKNQIQGEIDNYKNIGYPNRISKYLDINKKVPHYLIKKGNINDYYRREGKLTGANDWFTTGGDNIGDPMMWVHDNIKPRKHVTYIQSKRGIIDGPYYDPVRIYPKSVGPVPREAYKYSEEFDMPDDSTESVVDIDKLGIIKQPYTPNLSTDWGAVLRSEGKDGSYASRKKMYNDMGLAAKYGEYKGSANQNLAALNNYKNPTSNSVQTQPVQQEVISQQPKKEFSRYVNIHGNNYGFDTAEEFIDIARRKNLPQGWIEANIPKDLESQTKGLIAKLQTGGEYKVKSGDTFDGIANRLGVDKDEFRKANPGISYDNIKINQKLNIPVVEKREPTSWGDYINPMNWGVYTYDDAGNFKQAFAKARRDKQDEFMWYGKRYTTEYADELIKNNSTPSIPKEKKSKQLIFNEKFEKYKKDLIDQENPAKKGYDPEKKLWFPHEAPEEGGGFDIGYGHKIKKGEDFSKGLTNKQVNDLLIKDLNVKIKSAKNIFNNRNLSRTWDELDPEEQILLTDYQYNVGLTNFPKFTKALSNKDKEKMLEEYVRYSDGEPLGKRNDWTKSYIDTNLNYKTGGQLDDLKIYSNYINGNYDDIKLEKEAQKVYDKLNRIHYKNAKQFGMSAPNYIMTYLLKNPNG